MVDRCPQKNRHKHPKRHSDATALRHGHKVDIPFIWIVHGMYPNSQSPENRYQDNGDEHRDEECGEINHRLNVGFVECVSVALIWEKLPKHRNNLPRKSLKPFLSLFQLLKPMHRRNYPHHGPVCPLPCEGIPECKDL